MDLLHLVDRLEELVASAQKMPIGNRAIIDRRRLLDIIDQMRIAVPQEVRDAQEIVAHREALRREAEEDGRIIVAQAEERASHLVEAHELTAAARRRAEEIAAAAEAHIEERIAEANTDIQRRIQDSRQIAREQMSAADDSARELLQRLQRQLEAFVGSVRSGIQQLEPEPVTPARTESPRVERPYPDGPPAERPRDEVRVEHSSTEAAPRDPDERPRRREPLPPPQAPPVASASRVQTRAPIPLRREDEPEEELENLLRPRRREAPRPPAVIDDFEHEPLDDDPLLTREDEDRR